MWWRGLGCDRIRGVIVVVLVAVGVLARPRRFLGTVSTHVLDADQTCCFISSPRTRSDSEPRQRQWRRQRRFSGIRLVFPPELPFDILTSCVHMFLRKLLLCFFLLLHELSGGGGRLAKRNDSRRFNWLTWSVKSFKLVFL